MSDLAMQTLEENARLLEFIEKTNKVPREKWRELEYRLAHDYDRTDAVVVFYICRNGTKVLTSEKLSKGTSPLLIATLRLEADFVGFYEL